MCEAKGLAIYPTQDPSGVPVGFLHLLHHMPVLHDAIIFLTFRKASLLLTKLLLLHLWIVVPYMLLCVSFLYSLYSRRVWVSTCR